MIHEPHNAWFELTNVLRKTNISRYNMVLMVLEQCKVQVIRLDLVILLRKCHGLQERNLRNGWFALRNQNI